MRIECPHCHLTGNVNELEMPPEGRLVSCPRCKNSFHVDKPAVAVWSPDMMNVCPVCQYSTFGTEMFAVCPQCGLVGSEYQAKLRKRQELEREQQQARADQELLQRSVRNPDLSQAPAAENGRSATPLPVRYTGWACTALGVALLCYGLYGLASYYGSDWQTTLSEGRLEPLSKTEVFFRLGFLPWLFTLFSAVFLAMTSQFLLLRDHARKDMQKAAWAGVVVCAVYEAAEFISWVRISSSPSLFYYVVGIGSSVLMAVLWSLPFLALLWYLQSEAITREFPE
jgi:predicted Zn finger-like uncharacterized protein